jgi:hypothetical protein
MDIASINTIQSPTFSVGTLPGKQMLAVLPKIVAAPRWGWELKGAFAILVRLGEFGVGIGTGVVDQPGDEQFLAVARAGEVKVEV